MEGITHEPDRNASVVEALECIDEYEVLQFLTDKIRILEYQDTGETKNVTGQWGAVNINLKVSVKRPVPVFESASLNDIVTYHTVDEADEYFENYEIKKIKGTAYQEWIDSLPKPDDIQQAAKRIVASREAGVHANTLPCFNCEGERTLIYDCTCVHGGNLSYDGTVDNMEDTVVRDRDEGTPDPSCEYCGGEGKVTVECPPCQGSGRTAKYPYLLLIDESSGFQQRVELDLAALVASSALRMDEQKYEFMYGADSEYAHRSIAFAVGDYITQAITDMGLDTGNLGRVTQYGISETENVELNTINGGHAIWRKRGGRQIKEPHDDDYAHLSPADILDRAQLSVARYFAYMPERVTDSDGAFVGVEWLLRSLQPIEASLADLRDRVLKVTYKLGECALGYGKSNDETNLDGPVFYILDKQGSKIARLSEEYDLRAALESARINLERTLIVHDDFQSND